MYVVEILRYGDPALGVQVYGVFDMSREEIIAMMKEYNDYRGGKYPVIRLYNCDLNEAGCMYNGYDLIRLCGDAPSGVNNADVIYGKLDKIEAAFECLVSYDGDTDPDIDEDMSDDEIRAEYPVFWAARTLKEVIDEIMARPLFDPDSADTCPYGCGTS